MKSGYYWRCACGFEAHSYGQGILNLKRDAHRLEHTAQIQRITKEQS
jgi:hypothetical protein